MSDKDPALTTSRKRRISSLEIFTLPISPTHRSIHPIKRARIQELVPTSPTSRTETRNPVVDSTSTSSSSEDTSSSGSDTESDDEAASEVEDLNSTEEEDGSDETSSSSSSSNSDAEDSASPSLSLQARLATFLPSLASANRVLERERDQGILGRRDIERLEEEEEEYIEMDLGLGVLEEKREEDESSESESEEGSGMVDEERREKDVMSRLLGRRLKAEPKPSIQVVETVS